MNLLDFLGGGEEGWEVSIGIDCEVGELGAGECGET